MAKSRFRLFTSHIVHIMIKLAIICALYLCVKSQEYYDENKEWIGNFAVERMAEDSKRDYRYVDTHRMMGEAGYGSTIVYDLEIVVREGDELKLCEAKFLVNVYLQSYELLYYDCDKQNFEERDDMPMEDVEDDDSDYQDCAESDKQDILNEIINRLNDQVDETNSELDYEPPMMEMGMEDLKQKHYDHPSFDSCKKASRATGTVFKATILAQQDGIPQRCEIEMIVDGDQTSLTKSQCQGQN